jgi:HD-GYP domain-containing protein (c-di-GMP phosphodiesterase class II)
VIVAPLEFFAEGAIIVRHHHERLDGQGYPDGLKGEAVPLLAQIVGIADTYDAITTSRPYRAALPPEHAYAELMLEVEQGARRAELVEAFIALARRGALTPARSCRPYATLPVGFE